jgi:deoxyribodipyrimidine photolyase
VAAAAAPRGPRSAPLFALPGGLERYDRLAGGTSELSPYLHSRCLSARELEERALERGGDAFARQLAWRDFYAHVLLHHPGNARRAHKPEYDALEWDDDAELLRGVQQRQLAADRVGRPRPRPLLPPHYPGPVVDHREERRRAMALYGAVSRR